MTEQTIQKEIIKYLDSIGAYTIKTIRTNRAGTPDIICCLDGRFIAIEVISYLFLKGSYDTTNPRTFTYYSTR